MADRSTTAPKTDRGFTAKLSVTWLMVLMVFAWHGQPLTACCIGGLPWILHRRWERRRTR